MQALLARIARAARAPWHTLTPAQARAAYQAVAEVLEPPRAPLPRVQEIELAGRPARLYAAATGDRLPALLYLHGGGFVVGGLDTHDSLCRQLALRSGAVVIALDYRLAPEHPFPAAVEDSWAAIEWLAAQGGRIGVDPLRLAIGGDSAGATLATVAAIHARDLGIALALQLLITPGTAADTGSASHRRFAEGFLLDAADIAWFYDHTLARDKRRDWRFAPLEAPDLEGVAPVWLLLAECDPLVDEGLAYGDRLRAAGVAVELEIARGLTHDFIKMGRALKEAGACQQAAAEALRRAWGG